MTSRICIVCYDVSNNKTRRKLAKLISEYGKRVQGSVFLCDIDGERQRKLENKLRSFYMNSKKGPNKKKTTIFNKKRKKVLNTLDILLISLSPVQMEAALTLGNQLDITQKFIVI